MVVLPTSKLPALHITIHVPPLEMMTMRPALIPLPAHVAAGTGPGCRITAETPIIAEAGTRPEAELLACLLGSVLGRPLTVLDDGPNAGLTCIRLTRDCIGTDEAYLIDVDARGLCLRAATASGLGWATQTALQLFPPHAIHGHDLEAISICDVPRFTWRGAMLDPSRHFIPVDDVLRFIDLLARHRMNRLHLHLSDDQGWRIEIKRYPRLTSVGAWRDETLIGHYSSKTHTYDGIPHGGFYTQDDCRRIVAHAASRHITVVPEIDLPGHMQAAIAAYPWLGNDHLPCPVFTTWGINPHILNAEERTIRFLEDVLSEVMEIFPSPWIHIGGDEAIKDEWQATPRIQERIRELGCGDEHGLQAYIGHDVIMAPCSHTYFDHYQDPDVARQPLAIGGMSSLEKVYAFEPIPPELSADEARHVLGGQGQLWSEYILNRDQHDAMAFPRLCALAEVLWSPKAARDWGDFQSRLPQHLTRLEALGVAYFRKQ